MVIWEPLEAAATDLGRFTAVVVAVRSPKQAVRAGERRRGRVGAALHREPRRTLSSRVRGTVVPRVLCGLGHPSFPQRIPLEGVPMRMKTGLL